jgi:hypothetical protein
MPICLSAAEAAWPESVPLLPPFLKQYLTAKRGVEARLKLLAEQGVHFDHRT